MQSIVSISGRKMDLPVLDAPTVDFEDLVWSRGVDDARRGVSWPEKDDSLRRRASLILGRTS